MSADTNRPGRLDDPCSLGIDLPSDQPGIASGDWSVTQAGFRYLVVTEPRG